jgi:hypothetical protein
MNFAPRVVPAILDKRPDDNDVIADLRHAKRIMKCLARRLGNLQCHRVCADNLHHEGAILILTVAVIQNVLKSRIVPFSQTTEFSDSDAPSTPSDAARRTPRIRFIEPLPLKRPRRLDQAGLSSGVLFACYWITSSARPSSDGGIVRPRALAVLRLMTSSNFSGCWTGRSAGFAPLRILST